MKWKQWAIRLFLVGLSAGISWVSFLRITRQYFFDQLYYGKSEAFGYWVAGKTKDVAQFGQRSADVSIFYSYRKTVPAVLGASSDSYVVAVIGDSEVCGLGVLADETFPRLLQKKLNTIRKTTVLSLGSMGDDVVDNLDKYELLKRIANADLVVFVPVSNDILFNMQRKYRGDTLPSFEAPCIKEFGIAPVVNPNQPLSGEDMNALYRKANTSGVNWCVLRSAVARYPTERALYFTADSEVSDPNLMRYMNEFRRLGVHVLSAGAAKTDPRYVGYWKDSGRYFRVSALEDHPSALAHRMYADVLFREITTNPLWRFAQYRL